MTFNATVKIMPDRTMRSAAGAISRNPAKGVFIRTYASQAPEEVERTLADSAAAFRQWLLTAAVALLAASPAFADVTMPARGCRQAIHTLAGSASCDREPAGRSPAFS